VARPKQVDSKVPRGKAAFHTLLPAAAFLLGEPAGPFVVLAVGLIMTASVAGGPKFSVFGRLFNQVIRPTLKIKPGSPEEAAPHLFAEALGALFLLASAAALFLGATTLGWALALLVVALAALNWLAGICVGCQTYLIIARLRGRAKLAA
jgi:hypothetical protein